MPQTPTKHFGTIDYDEGAVLTFPLGLPAFEDQNRFVLIETPSTSPVVFLQSLTKVDVCLPAVPIRVLDREYELALTADDLAALGGGLPSPEGVACFAVISAPAGGTVTANLLAPVVVNLASRTAVQAVRPDARYSHRHPLGMETRREEEAVCS